MAAEAAAAAEGIDRLQGLPDAVTARKALASARSLHTKLRAVVLGLSVAAPSAVPSYETAGTIDRLDAKQLLALHEEVAVAIEAAEAATPAARESQRDHEAAVVAGYDALGLAASRLAQLVGVSASLSVDKSAAGQAAARLATLVSEAEFALANARQGLRDATITMAPDSTAVDNAMTEVPPLEAMHKVVQDAITAVAAAGESPSVQVWRAACSRLMAAVSFHRNGCGRAYKVARGNRA